MNFPRKSLATALLIALSGAAQAEIAIDVIGPYEVSLEGLVQADGSWFDNDVVDLNGAGSGDGDDTEFGVRRAELVLKGKGSRFDWVLGYDAHAEKFLDTNLRWKLGSSYMQFGQFKQPNSFEELSSTKNNDFIAKSMTTNLFAVGRRVGVAYGHDAANWGYNVSAFGRELTRNLAHGSGFGGRVWWLPMQDDEGFLHLGVSANDRDTDADSLRLRVRPDADQSAVRLLDTGNLTNADRMTTLGLEAAWARGPWKVQGEYMRASVDRYAGLGAGQTGSDFNADSWYVSGMWNLTGERWGYKKGVVTTGLPDDPAAGMWQVGVRLDSANLDDGIVQGGDGKNITLGVNWYWRSNFKFALNYVDVQTDRRGVSDDPSIVEARAQFYW